MNLISINNNQFTFSEISYNNIHLSFDNHVEFFPEKEHMRKLCFSVSIWRNLLLNYIKCFKSPMVVVLYRKQHAEIGFINFKTAVLIWATWNLKLPKKVENHQLQVLLDEDVYQSQKIHLFLTKLFLSIAVILKFGIKKTTVLCLTGTNATLKRFKTWKNFNYKMQ